MSSRDVQAREPSDFPVRATSSIESVAQPVDQSAFRGALGRFASGVTVVTTRVDGEDHASTASAFTSVALDPPLVLVCVDHKSRFHAAVSKSRNWAVSILSEDNQAASTWFATRGRPLAGQLDRVPHRRGCVLDAPLIDGALAWLECETWQAYDGVDHTIVVGHVVHAEVAEADDRPLLYYRSHYASLRRSTDSEKNS